MSPGAVRATRVAVLLAVMLGAVAALPEPAVQAQSDDPTETAQWSAVLDQSIYFSGCFALGLGPWKRCGTTQALTWDQVWTEVNQCTEFEVPHDGYLFMEVGSRVPGGNNGMPVTVAVEYADPQTETWQPVFGEMPWGSLGGGTHRYVYKESASWVDESVKPYRFIGVRSEEGWEIGEQYATSDVVPVALDLDGNLVVPYGAGVDIYRAGSYRACAHPATTIWSSNNPDGFVPSTGNVTIHLVPQGLASPAASPGASPGSTTAAALERAATVSD
jgi:hypothetical protein